MIKLHVALAEEECAGLDELATKTGRSRSFLIRDAVGEYLAERRHQSLHETMRKHAEKAGPYSGEFVKESESHAAERLLRETKW